MEDEFFYGVMVWKTHAIAHALDRSSRLSFSLQVWMESIPLDLISIVYADLPVI